MTTTYSIYQHSNTQIRIAGTVTNDNNNNNNNIVEIYDASTQSWLPMTLSLPTTTTTTAPTPNNVNTKKRKMNDLATTRTTNNNNNNNNNKRQKLDFNALAPDMILYILSFHSFMDITTNEWRELFAKFPTGDIHMLIQNLSLKERDIKKKNSFILQRASRLYIDCFEVTTVLETIHKYAPNVQELYLKNRHSGIASLEGQEEMSSKVRAVSMCYDHSTIDNLLYLPNVQQLDFTATSHVNPTDIERLKRVKDLCVNLEINDSNLLKQLNNITELNMVYSMGIPMTDLNNCASSLKTLKCIVESGEEVTHVLKTFKQLECLDITCRFVSCEISDDLTEEIAKSTIKYISTGTMDLFCSFIQYGEFSQVTFNESYESPEYTLEEMASVAHAIRSSPVPVQFYKPEHGTSMISELGNLDLLCDG